MTHRAKTISRRLLRSLLSLAALVALVAIVAPQLNAARFGQAVQRQIENLLGRRIQCGKMTYSVFPGPGFSLENVTIFEDARYGLEPFAYVATLDARLRIDKLLLGKLQFSSLHMAEPLINVVKRKDGAWNVVELVDRLSAPQVLPLSLFPAVEVSDARLEFQFDKRKTTLYIADADLSIYPERSGKLYIQFSGSPARTDRAGTGFGHLRGTANWYLKPSGAQGNQLEANVTLDPSNLSELTTLFEGYDIGVHGKLSSQARIEGPATALRIAGQLQLEDVHRWDLFSAQGEDWSIRYGGSLDLVSHSFNLETVPWQASDATPVVVQVRANNFLAQPAWSVFARLNQAPAANLLPLGKRMGVGIPDGLSLQGTLNGVIGYSNRSGLAGGVAVSDAIAVLPNLPPLRTALATTTVTGDCVHFDPAIVETSFPGVLKAGGDYCASSRHVLVALSMEDVPIKPLRDTVSAWFARPTELDAFASGEVSGQMRYRHDAVDSPGWSGQVQLTGARIETDGLAVPLKHFASHIVFDETSLDMNRFTATIADAPLTGEYHYNQVAKRTERLRLELISGDISTLQTALDPTLRAKGFFARLRFGRRALPAWAANRNLEADLVVDHLLFKDKSLGSLHTHLLWDGPQIQVTALQMTLPVGLLAARGTLSIANLNPRYRFSVTATSLPWKGGFLTAAARLDTSGIGSDALLNLRAQGTFDGRDVTVAPDNQFSKVTGTFEFAFAQGWPDIKVTTLRAEGTEEWEGQGSSQSDGKLLLDLQHAGRQRHLESTLTPSTTPPPGP